MALERVGNTYSFVTREKGVKGRLVELGPGSSLPNVPRSFPLFCFLIEAQIDARQTSPSFL